MSRELWDKLSPVEKSAQKEYKRSGGFKGTDINPQWRMMRMTEEFGPVGLGWGWEVKERWSETFDNDGTGNETFVFVMLLVWYMVDGKKCWTGEQIGGTDTKWAKDEAYKMAVTDALGKCCASIGLGAEIYLGQFDRDMIAAHFDGTISEDEVAHIKALLKETNTSEEDFLTTAKVDSLDQIKDSRYRLLLNALETKKKRQSA